MYLIINVNTKYVNERSSINWTNSRNMNHNPFLIISMTQAFPQKIEGYIKPLEMKISFIMMSSSKHTCRITFYYKIKYFVGYFDNFACKVHFATLHLNACHRMYYNNGFLTWISAILPIIDQENVDRQNNLSALIISLHLCLVAKQIDISSITANIHSFQCLKEGEY